MCYRATQQLQTFGAMKILFTVSRLSLGAKRELCERVVVPTVMHGAETCDMRMDESHETDVSQIKCLQSSCGVTRMDIWRNKELSRRVGVREKMTECIGKF